LCQQELEDHWHLLECWSLKQDLLYDALLKDLKQMHQKQNVDIELFHLLQAGLSAIHHIHAPPLTKPSSSLHQYKNSSRDKRRLAGINFFMAE